MKNKRENSFRSRLLDAMELPSDMLGSEPFVYLKINGELCVNGCEEILKYETDEVKLRLTNGVIGIYGSALTMKSFFERDMIVRGRISGIRIEER